MKEMAKFVLILGLVTSIAAYALGLVNQITQPRIALQQQLALHAGLYAVLPGSENGCLVAHPLDNSDVYYTGYKNPDTTDFIGYALPVFSKGYSSTIRTLVGLDSLQNIIKIEILFQQETPGLGTKCEEIRPGENEPWFQKQFEGVFAQNVLLQKEGGPIQSITGATITSAAITDAVSESLKKMVVTIDSLE